jgi:integrase
LLDFEFLACGGDASIANMHGDTKSNCKYRRGTSAFRAYVMQQQKSSASAEPSCFAKLTTFATWWKVMDNPGKRLIILSSAEIDALYGRPRFTQEERTEYFALSDSKRAALSQLHPTLAQFLKAWNVQTPYARETDFVFFSLKANGRIPVSPAVLVADHLRLAAIKAGVQIAKGQRFSLHNLRHSLSNWLVNKGKVDPKTVQSILRHSRIQTTLDLYTQGDGDETRAAQGAFLKELGLATEMVQ